MKNKRYSTAGQVLAPIFSKRYPRRKQTRYFLCTRSEIISARRGIISLASLDNKILLAIIFFLALTLAGCAHGNPSSPQNAAVKNGYDFVAIKNPQQMIHNTLVVYKPADWQEQKINKILYYLPPGATASSTVDEKIVVVVYSIPAQSTTTLAEFMHNDFALNQKTEPGLKFVTSTEPVKLGPLAGREEKYINQIIGKKIFIDQIEARSGDLLYKIRHSCGEGSCLSDAIFAEMVDSFEIIPQSAAGQ
jgi:hypothetical protein